MKVGHNDDLNFCIGGEEKQGTKYFYLLQDNVPLRQQVMWEEKEIINKMKSQEENPGKSLQT